jgi:hypothetical protein
MKKKYLRALERFEGDRMSAKQFLHDAGPKQAAAAKKAIERKQRGEATFTTSVTAAQRRGEKEAAKQVKLYVDTMGKEHEMVDSVANPWAKDHYVPPPSTAASAASNLLHGGKKRTRKTKRAKKTRKQAKKTRKRRRTKRRRRTSA